MKNSQGGSAMTAVLVAVIVLLILAGGIYVYETQKAPASSASAPTMPAPMPVSTDQGQLPPAQSPAQPSSNGPASAMQQYTDPQAGLSFQYPASWGAPMRSISSQGTYTIEFKDEGIDIWDDPISDLGQNMTIDSFLSKVEAGTDVQTASVVISGETATEISHPNYPGYIDIYLPDDQGNLITLEQSADSAGQISTSANISQILQSFKIFAPTSPSVGQMPGWKTYSDPQVGVSFQYPASLNNSYVELGSVSASSDSSNSIDDKGCYEIWGMGSGAAWNDSKDMPITLNGTAFCVSTAGDVGAGHLTTIYDYTTKANGVYITLNYTVGGPNGCGAYGGTGDLSQQSCEGFFGNDYNNDVILPIQQSAGTLTLTE